MGEIISHTLTQCRGSSQQAGVNWINSPSNGRSSDHDKTTCRRCDISTYLHCYVCVQWSRPFRSWSKPVLDSQTVPPKNLRFLIVAECSLTGSEQRQPLGCAQLRLHRHTGRPHVHVVLARCCQSALRVHHWEWGCCPPAPPVRPCQWIARYVGHTVWGSGPFRGCMQGYLHRAFDRAVLRWEC